MNGLVCLGKMLEHLDKYAVLDDILPLMNQIPSREPPTLMAILGEVDLKTSMGMELRFGKNPPLRILFFAFVSSDNTRFMFRSFELPFELHLCFCFQEFSSKPCFIRSSVWTRTTLRPKLFRFSFL